MAACVTHPLDLTKLRMQTLTSSGASLSTVKVLRDAIAFTGVRSLYTGLSASVLRQMTYSLVRLGSYEGIKSWIAKGSTTHVVTRTSPQCIFFLLKVNIPPQDNFSLPPVWPVDWAVLPEILPVSRMRWYHRRCSDIIS